MAINPYGLHDLPAVGGGSPGLPRRASSEQAKSLGPRFEDYNVIFVSGEKIELWAGSGELIAYQAQPSSTIGQISLSEDETLLAISTTGAAGPVTLYDTKNLDIVSRVNAPANIGPGAAVHVGLGLISFASSSGVIRIYDLADFISLNGGDLTSLTPVDSFNSSVSGPSLIGVAWNLQGTIIAYNGLGSATGAGLELRDWPSKTLLANPLPDASGAGATPCEFSGNGRGLFVKAGGSHSNVIGAHLFELEYDSHGQFSSIATRIYRQHSTSAGTYCSGIIEGDDAVLAGVYPQSTPFVYLQDSRLPSGFLPYISRVVGVCKFGFSKDGKVMSLPASSPSGEFSSTTFQLCLSETKDEIFNPLGNINTRIFCTESGPVAVHAVLPVRAR